MVFVAKVRGCWYVYRSYRVPGEAHPRHEYLGPASDYPGGKKLVQRKLRKLEEKEKAEQKKMAANKFDYSDGESGE